VVAFPASSPPYRTIEIKQADIDRLPRDGNVMDDVLIGKIYEIIYTSVLIGSIYDTRPLNGRLSIRNSILWMNEIVTSGRDGARRMTMACVYWLRNAPSPEVDSVSENERQQFRIYKLWQKANTRDRACRKTPYHHAAVLISYPDRQRIEAYPRTSGRC
jgi:hypothetical protein